MSLSTPKFSIAGLVTQHEIFKKSIYQPQFQRPTHQAVDDHPMPQHLPWTTESTPISTGPAPSSWCPTKVTYHAEPPTPPSFQVARSIKRLMCQQGQNTIYHLKSAIPICQLFWITKQCLGIAPSAYACIITDTCWSFPRPGIHSCW